MKKKLQKDETTNEWMTCKKKEFNTYLHFYNVELKENQHPSLVPGTSEDGDIWNQTGV